MTMSFADFYQHIHGNEPHEWQEKLAHDVIERGRWYEAVSAVTGAGKTSVLDIAIWTLYCQLSEGIDRTLPLRVALAVERRMIVDEAYLHAKKIADAIDTKGELAGVRGVLRSLLPDYLAQDSDNPTIMTLSMHGASTWDEMWWRPVGATIVTGTMTQIVSRVLYRGVGVSPGRRSIDAAILGTDTVRFIDEPHLMVNAAVALREQEKLVRRYVPSTVVLGATIPRSLVTDDTFFAQIDASTKRWRPLVFVSEPSKADMIKRMADLAINEHNDQGEVVVIVSTTATARDIAQAIMKKKVEVKVITSKIRPHDRSNLGVFPSKEFITVATQTIEVGVDYDAKTIISDIAPLPSLIQRAGRAGRHGRSAEVFVVSTEKLASLAGHIGVYGLETLQKTHELLESDVKSLDDLNAMDYPDTWVAESRCVKLEEHMADLLSDTFADAPWEAFLRGPDFRESLSVRVLWRDEPDLAHIVTPSKDEEIEVPLSAIKNLLIGKKDIDFADTDVLLEEKAKHGSVEIVAYQLHYDQDEGLQSVRITHTREIHPGATVILPTSAGFYHETWGWDSKSTAPVPDISYETREQAARKNRQYYYVTALSLPEITHETLRAHQSGEEAIVLPPKHSFVEGGRVIRIHRTTDKTNQGYDHIVYLADHLKQVAVLAEATAQKSPSRITSDEYYRAGIHHDLGKKIPGFQSNVLGNTNEAEPPWAKSWSESQRIPIFLTGKELPRPWRHESGIANALYRAGFHDAAWLVADHHGRGNTHPEGTVLNEVVPIDRDSTSPWDRSYESAVFRYADWYASKKPEVYGITLSDLDINSVTDDELRSPVTCSPQQNQNTYRLTGLVEPTAGYMAAFGAFAVALEQDPNALIRFVDDVAEIATSNPIIWSPIAGEFSIVKNHKVKGDIPVHFTQDYWAKTKPEDTILAACLIHNNGKPAAKVLDGGVSIDVLFDPEAGWKTASKMAGFDYSSGIKAQRLPEPVYRADIYAWIVRGQLSWGAPTGPHGAGSTVDNKFCIPVPTNGMWVTKDEIIAAARRGYGLILAKYSITDYQMGWQLT